MVTTIVRLLFSCMCSCVLLCMTDIHSDTLYDESEVMDSPTSLGTQDSGITMGTTGADTELLAKVIEVV